MLHSVSEPTNIILGLKYLPMKKHTSLVCPVFRDRPFNFCSIEHELQHCCSNIAQLDFSETLPELYSQYINATDRKPFYPSGCLENIIYSVLPQANIFYTITTFVSIA
jgi:hypothetical protein